MQTPPLAHRPAAVAPWLLVPALFSALTLLAAGFGYRSSYLPDAPLWLSLPYLLPLGLAASLWRRPHTPEQRRDRVVLGTAACAAALLYARAAEGVLFCVAIVVWLVQGD
ncbi:hypothetical protein ABT144_23115 [Streptomyces sp. NPDC002039]|uniref:hypothetical protein n=1 Tax=unclassified Streptomyces TaxID=2593676 RepID=UPI00332387AC